MASVICETLGKEVNLGMTNRITDEHVMLAGFANYSKYSELTEDEIFSGELKPVLTNYKIVPFRYGDFDSEEELVKIGHSFNNEFYCISRKPVVHHLDDIIYATYLKLLDGDMQSAYALYQSFLFLISLYSSDMKPSMHTKDIKGFKAYEI